MNRIVKVLFILVPAILVLMVLRLLGLLGGVGMFVSYLLLSMLFGTIAYTANRSGNKDVYKLYIIVSILY